MEYVQIDVCECNSTSELYGFLWAVLFLTGRSIHCLYSAVQSTAL
jgi:hypothetical protein